MSSPSDATPRSPPDPLKTHSSLSAASDASGGSEPEQGSQSLAVGAGVLSSRLLGLVRDRVLAHLLGIGPWRDLYEALFRGANLLQNLLGEQALSAAFLPLYSRFRSAGSQGQARRFALAVLLQLLIVVLAIVTVSWFAAPWLVRFLYPGWGDDPARLQDLVLGLRILLPMSGVLVLSAWCLAILNAHGRFFLPYFAPVSWNVAVLAALGAAAWSIAREDPSGAGLAAPESQRLIVFWACWGGLVGGALQFLVQWFPARRCIGAGGWSWHSKGIGAFRKTFGPALLGRGVVQLSSYIDQALASFLAAGALAAMGNAFRIYFLAATMVATTIVVVELPALSRLLSDGGDNGANSALQRLRRSFADATFLTVPTSVGLMVLSVPIVAALFQTGQFGRAESHLVGSVVALYALALVPSTASRLVQNLLFALGNTAAPAKVSMQRLLVSVACGLPAMLYLDRFLVGQVFSVGSSQLRLGACGLALGSAVGAWYELVALHRRCAAAGLAPTLPWARVAVFLPMAFLAALVSLAGWSLLEQRLPPIVLGPLLVASFAGIYCAVAAVAAVPELAAVWQRWRPRLKR